MIGVDIVKISRIKQSILKFGEKFIAKFFNDEEIKQSLKYATNLTLQYRYFAKRFAAKEAYIKALGSAKGVIMRNIAVLNDTNGKPMLFVNGKNLNGGSISLSDDGDYAIAYVVLNGV